MTRTATLTKESANQALAAACERVGLDAAGAELVRLGSNAVFRLADPVIVRIARDGDTVEDALRQVAVARWLETESYPANRALNVEQPVDVHGHVATFWESLSEITEYATVVQVAQLVRKLHSLEAPAHLALPLKRPFVELYSRLEGTTVLDPTDSDFLRRRIDDLKARYETLHFVLTPGVIHGDANVGNVILNRNGDPVLIDLDSFCVGPREWDLIQTALFYDRFDWHTDEEYRQFVAVYGFDIMKWAGYPVLADYREIAMTLWLCGNAGADERAADEVRKRVESIRSGGNRRDWAPF